MAVVGTGGGLINGETQKAIMTTMPPNRRGMASGVSTTTRFVSMLTGYAGLSAVMASGIQQALRARVCDGLVKACVVPHEMLTAVVSGRIVKQGAQGIVGYETAINSYRVGFESLHITAAMVALLAAGVSVALAHRAGDHRNMAREPGISS